MPTLEDFEKSLLAGRAARMEAVELSEDILSDIATCKKTLMKLKSEVAEFKSRCNTIKTAGATFGAVASVCTVGIHFLTLNMLAKYS